MKILAVTLDGKFSGGANRSFLMVITQLRDMYGHEIDVVVPENGQMEEKLSQNNFKYEVVEMPLIHFNSSGSFKDILKKIYMNYLVLVHKIKACNFAKNYKNKYDLVYINGNNQFFGYFLAKELNIPFVWHLRGLINKGQYYCYNQGEIYSDKNGKVIVISNAMIELANKILNIDINQIEMIHNGLEWKDNLVSNQDWSNGIHCILCGRIARSKSHLEALKALATLKNRGYKDVYLHIVGDVNDVYKPYLDELKKFVNENDLNQNVVFEGQIEEMSSFRCNMNIELMCSTFEPFGRVTLEGMHSGLVVIGANTGGTLDIIKDKENGYLYQQGNSEDLADKIEFVINNPDIAKNISKNAVEFANTHFTMLENVTNINNLILQVKKNCKE